MEYLSGDYDNAFTVTKGRPFGGSRGRCVQVRVWWWVTFHCACVPTGDKSNKNDRRDFGY